MKCILFAVLLNVVESRSTGAPAGACATLTPQHGVTPQTSPVPYEVDISSLSNGNGGYSYSPGQSYMCM